MQSTLFNLLQGKLPVAEGYIRINPNLRLGVFTQHHLDSFDLAKSPLQNMMARWPLANEVSSHIHTYTTYILHTYIHTYTCIRFHTLTCYHRIQDLHNAYIV